MKKILAATAASLLLAVAPIHAADVETETEVEKRVESDEGKVETKSTVETERERADGSTESATVETKREDKVGALGGVESEVHKKTETTTVE